jgi:molybdate transport system substrate-binding protein
MPASTRRTFLAILAAAAVGGPARAAPGLIVFAAASLKTALDLIAARWSAATGNQVAISYAASSALARQIENGAPADIFISADLEWMDDVEAHGLVRRPSRFNLLGNDIVLVAPAGPASQVEIRRGFDLAALLGDGRLAVADVAAVPAGKYARSSLQSLGIWDGVKDRLAQAENVRAALKLVATGEAPLGIVYRTDAAAEPQVQVIGVLPPSSHPPIVYPVATLAASQSAAAASFLAFLVSAEARTIFAAQGFVVLAPRNSS